MNTESIKVLRNKISIPLNQAIRLLKKNNDDIELCEQEFHNDNIKIISIKTECDYDVAKENYELCNYDVVKTVERINQKPIIITTGKATDSKIGFVLWPENGNGEFYKTAKRNDAFIPTEDFDLFLKEFQAVFPLRNPWNDIIEDEFDKTGHNFFDHKTIRLIVEKIKLIENENEKENAFLLETINWLNDKLVYAEYIVVYGNL